MTPEDSYLPGELAAKLDQALPEVRYIARMLAAFYHELDSQGVPQGPVTLMVCEFMRQVSEDLNIGEESSGPEDN